MQNSDALRALYSRMQPVLPELFNMAYAICGNREQAEYALQYALVDAWTGENHGGVGFREGLRNTLRSVALEEALKPSEAALEFTWNGLSGETEDEAAALLARENTEIRRMAALRYGCGLSAARTGRLMGLSSGQVQETLDRLERSVDKRLSAKNGKKYDGGISQAVRREFRRTDPAMPSAGVIYRTFAAGASEIRRPSHLAVRIVRRVLYVLTAVLCALMFWLTAVLMQPVRTVEMPPKETAADAVLPTAEPEDAFQAASAVPVETAIPQIAAEPQTTENPGVPGVILETVTLQE